MVEPGSSPRSPQDVAVPANPYAPTTQLSDLAATQTDAESIRRRYLRHETSIRTMASFFLMMGGVCVVALVLIVIALFDAPAIIITELISMLVIVSALGAASLALAIGLRRLKNWSRIATMLLCVLGLLGFPLFTLLSIYFLYLVASKKGDYVFSKEYHEVIEQTPHVRYRTSAFAWTVLLFIMLTFGTTIVYFLAMI